MLQNKLNLFLKLSLLILVTASTNSFASTICSFNCPDIGTGGSDSTLSQIVEITSNDTGNLLIDNDGLIILDSNLFNTLSGLTINSTTPVYQGISQLPSTIILPDTLELSTVSFTGDFSISGATIDYLLLREFNSISTLDLTTTNGILVMDTSSLFTVPLPGAIILMLSGIIALFAFGTRKRN